MAAYIDLNGVGAGPLAKDPIGLGRFCGYAEAVGGACQVLGRGSERVWAGYVDGFVPSGGGGGGGAGEAATRRLVLAAGPRAERVDRAGGGLGRCC